jgi:hypothetical protein
VAQLGANVLGRSWSPAGCRTAHELAFLPDLTCELRAWPYGTWATPRVDPQAGTASCGNGRPPAAAVSAADTRRPDGHVAPSARLKAHAHLVLEMLIFYIGMNDWTDG